MNPVHQFADDTNLLPVKKSLKQINKLINHDLPLLVQKTFVTLSGFWPLRGWGKGVCVMNLLFKGNLSQKFFFI